MATTTSLTRHRVLGADELPEGRVTTVAAGHLSIALTHVDGRYAALDNHGPHQGGPLGEGSIAGPGATNSSPACGTPRSTARR
jgi:nitrite reductase/ring-hydroxylating ferredoxin subunit